ncbi:response regulator [Alteriqipengyuania flavescens]|uniref:response regulator n=1 Tax=Alteriqipengyuania flavescens TaxID=3053610 RepID=UPI0025B56158|nr:response regulator [Alteriqipengyuania flavescens]WJY19433.1 response regulator [Alteriqipengyuania flavescens]WJY25375.1 response regulator [Alteriqipengyuania flavescens]
MTKRILLVEDNDLNRKLFGDVLKAGGHDVMPIADGSQALEAMRRFGPDLVIMDIQLPNISGLDLIAEIRRDPALKAVPVLAVTAYAGKGDEEKIRDAGADNYLAKPVSIGPFMQAVNALLAPAPGTTLSAAPA